MKALVISAMFLMVARTSFAATSVNNDKSTATNDLTDVTSVAQPSASDTSYPSLIAKPKTVYSNDRSVISRVMPVVGMIDSNLVGGSTDDSFSSKIGLQVGGLMDIGHSDAVLETGVLYRQLGATIESAQVNLNYIAIPVGGKYYFSGQEDSSVFINGGIMPQFAVSRTISSGSASVDASGIFGSFDLDAYLGVGGKISMGDRTDFVVDLTYSRGLTNLNATQGDATFNNSAFGLTAGVAFAL